jgi:glycosyltransferase involved in cell wall biosynthesis
VTIALDATYSLGDDLSGIGVYSRRLLAGLARSHPDVRFHWCYRPHRLLGSLRESLPPNCRRRMLQEPLWTARSAGLFHGLNQRLPDTRSRRAVSTFHDLFVLTGDYSSPDFRRRFEAQARHAARNSDLILAVSEFTAGQVEQLLGVERARIRVVHHGVDSATREVGERRQKIVLHVGAIQKRKNVARLVRAFTALGGGWRLVLAGALGYGAEEALAEIERSPRRESIELRGYVSADALQELYATASIFAFPSLDEGFGMPVLEAMAAGVAVLTSDRSALPEVTGDAALLTPPEETEAIAAGLTRLASDEVLRNDLVKRGRARAAQFTWEAAVEKTWYAYEELLSPS